MDVRRRRRRDLGRERLGPLLGLGPEGDLGVHHLGRYAGYLHARATAGWKGRKAASSRSSAFACFIFNYFGVNIFLGGLHSYSGLN